MKTVVLLLLAAALVIASIVFFHRCGEFLGNQDYLAGIVHIFVGSATIRFGVELARLAVLTRMRP